MTAFVFSGALIWHIWWLVIITFIAVVAMIILRTMDDFTEYTIPAAEVMKMDKEARA
jgi:cytochrome o ubiquinol oxidase subunit 1